ncbi:MAG: hypothetical protein M3Q29_14120 [Chloroflexota bacterium]|nr:hypothetical protein [Chloroflexota bacterium]
MGPGHLAGAVTVERGEALARFAVLRGHLGNDAPLTRSAREAGIPRVTLQRWPARCRQDGLAGL